MVKLADNLDFGAKMLSNTAVGSGEFMIEFYDDIIRIPDKAFYMSKLNGKIDLPMSVKSIGAYAFTKTACTDFFLPDRVTEIGEGAFESCYNFRTLNLPRDLKKSGLELLRIAFYRVTLISRIMLRRLAIMLLVVARVLQS